jgi:1,4-dihydroxy-2-naphthoyl-CoA hydrolase
MDLLARFNEDPLPFAKWLGIELVSATPDRIVAQMTVREHLCTRPSVLHGGAIMAFSDTLGALGTVANLEPGFSTVTIESKTNFVAPAPLFARLLGEATPVHRGRTTMIWQTRITTQEGKLVALTVQTQLVVPRRTDASLAE